MSQTIRIETQLDDARNRVKNLQTLQATTLDVISSALCLVGTRIGATEADCRRAREAARDLMDDLFFDIGSEAESLVLLLEDELADIEQADLHRSSPVVL